MENPIASKSLDHLGLVAGMIDQLGIVEGIDSKVPQDMTDRHISIGLGVKAMLLNGLGFSQRTLYMVSSYFENLPVELLLGESIDSSHLNDSVLGRILDEIYEYGCTKLYSELAPQICKSLDLVPQVLCMDSTDFHLDGKYNGDIEVEEGSQVLHLTRGYSRDHRGDLNQVVLNLIVENQAGIAVHMEAHSGNKSDKTIFRETITQHISQLQNAYDVADLLMDSAGYTAETIKEHSGRVHWISRVPETIKEAKTAIEEGGEMSYLSEGYSYRMTTSNYGEVEQRWAIIHSEEAYKKEMITLKKNYVKESEKVYRLFEKMSNQKFSCEKDAQKYLAEFCKKYPILEMNNLEIQAIAQYKGQGRPAKDTQPSHYIYHIQANCASSIAHFNTLKQHKGKFIIATNNLDKDKTPDAQMLANYKSLSKAERGFRFLKDPQFVAASFFVKKPERVEALLFIMTLCLSVYAAIEYQARQKLIQTNQTLPNQVNKEVNNPTARWIFTMMAGVHVLYLNDNQPIILNLTDKKKKIIDLMGGFAGKYYLRI
jgi:transposase